MAVRTGCRARGEIGSDGRRDGEARKAVCYWIVCGLDPGWPEFDLQLPRVFVDESDKSTELGAR